MPTDHSCCLNPLCKWAKCQRATHHHRAAHQPIHGVKRHGHLHGNRSKCNKLPVAMLYGNSWVLLPSSNNDPNTVKWSSSSSIPQLSVTPYATTFTGLQFRLVATAANGTTTPSSPVIFSILSITSQPTSQSTVLNGTDIFTATVVGAVSYQWQYLLSPAIGAFPLRPTATMPTLM